MVIRKIYKRYFFDFCYVYSKLRKDKDEVNAAYITISRVLAVFIWSIVVLHKAIYENDNTKVMMVILVSSMILSHLINYKWVKEFKKWKGELPPVKKQIIKWNNLYLISVIFNTLFIILSFMLLYVNHQNRT